MAAVAGAPLRLKLCPRLFTILPRTPLRLASTVARQDSGRSRNRSSNRSSNSNSNSNSSSNSNSNSNSSSSSTINGKPKPRNTIRRFIPEEVKRFVRPDGRLLTTRENRDFLIEHDIEPDNGTMIRFTAGPELKKLASEFNVTLAYSPRHVIHPHDLRFFEPRGHPLAAMKRAKYLRKTLDEPLWVFMTSAGGASAVVRTLTRRRMKAALYRALETLGHKSGGDGGEGMAIQGTLWVTIHNPVKAASLPAERFVRVLAEALDQQCSRRKM